MNEPNKNPNELNQTLALTRFKARNFVEDLQRDGLALAEALRQASLRPWPDENGDYYAVRTLEDWWYAYQKGGFNALMPAPRSDQGKSRVLDQATAAWVLEQVTQNPKAPLKVLYCHWQQSQQRPLPSISVLYRFLRRQGMDRKSLRSGRLESGATKAFEAPQVNDLWMVDFSPGPTLTVNGKKLSTQLCVLVDDHSRLIPFAAYYPQANTEAFHHALKEALLRRGIPRKLYVDYVARHIIDVLCPTALCGQHENPPVNAGRSSRGWPHNFQRALSHFSSSASSLQTERAGRVARQFPTGGWQASSAFCFMRRLISA